MIKHLAVIVVGLAVIGVLYAAVIPTLPKTGGVASVACTEEAMICPDGSAVGRTGPNCEFAKCPDAPPVPTEVGTVSGTVLLGPVCPVQHDPPEEACADKPYEGDFVLVNGGITKSVRSNAKGLFSVEVPVGTYRLSSVSQRVMPSCAPVESVVVEAGQNTSVVVSCDSGIR
jgi:hypothetical protein